MIYGWKSEYKTKGDISFSVNGNEQLLEEEAKIARLKEQLKDAQEEPDIWNYTVALKAGMEL